MKHFVRYVRTIVTMNQRSVSILFVISVLLTFVVIYDVVLWWTVCTTSSGIFNETLQQYLHHYPSSWRNPTILTIASIIVSVIAGSCFVKIFNETTGAARIAAKVLSVTNFIFASWHLFSLM